MKCQVTRICTCSQLRDCHWSGSMVFFAAMLGPYSKSFEVVTLGSKSSRFAIPKLERNSVAIFFAARLFGFAKSIHTAFIFYI